MVSMMTSTSGSSRIGSTSVVTRTPSSRTPRGLFGSRTAAHFQRIGRPAPPRQSFGMLGQQPRHTGPDRSQPDQANRDVSMDRFRGSLHRFAGRRVRVARFDQEYGPRRHAGVRRPTVSTPRSRGRRIPCGRAPHARLIAVAPGLLWTRSAGDRGRSNPRCVEDGFKDILLEGRLYGSPATRSPHLPDHGRQHDEEEPYRRDGVGLVLGGLAADLDEQHAAALRLPMPAADDRQSDGMVDQEPRRIHGDLARRDLPRLDRVPVRRLERGLVAVDQQPVRRGDHHLEHAVPLPHQARGLSPAGLRAGRITSRPMPIR